MDPRPPLSKITLRDIAISLGISHSAVSRALHNSPLVSVSLRKQIQDAAKKMGYRPNPMAVALGQQRRTAAAHAIQAEIAWINYWRDPQELRKYKEFDSYWRGAVEKAEQCGYRLEEFVCHGCIPPSRLEKILLTRNIRGILIPPHRRVDLPEELSSCHWENYSIVRFGYSVPYPDVSVVGLDQTFSGALAFENIRRLGYRRIGYVYCKGTTGKAQAGFLLEQQELPWSERVPILVLPANTDDIVKISRLRSWLDEHRPDAILSDIAAMRGMLEKAGFSVPEDIGLATTSVLDGNSDAGISQNSAEIGKVAVEMLVGLINYNQTGIPSTCHHVLLEGSWVDGSCLPDRNPVLIR